MCNGFLTRFGVTLEAKHDLRCSVPTGGHVLCHETNVRLCIIAKSACESKVANLEFAIGVDQQIARLQVAVKDVGRVDVFEPSADLIDEVLKVGVGQGLLGSNNLVKVCFHQLLNQVTG